MKSYLPIFIILIIIGLFYYISNSHPTDHYKHYVYLANAFLNGRFDTPDLPSYYQDSVIKNNHRYLIFPPAPAFFLLPLVFIWGTALNQVYVSMTLGIINVALVFILLNRLKIKKSINYYTCFAFGLGTVHYYAAVIGTTWFFAHIMAVFFLLLALIETFGKRRPILLGLLFCLSFFSRQSILAALPFFLIMLKKEISFKNYWPNVFLFFLSLLPFILFEAYYNFARFGNIFDDGHFATYLYYNANVAHSLFKSYGFLDPRNIPANLYTLFLMLPDSLNAYPFLKPSPYGLSVLLTSPVLLFSLLAPKNNLNKLLWLGAALTALVCFCHFSQGWVQFGYRYLLDFLPFLIILVACGIRRLTYLSFLLLIYSVIVNMWGVYWGITLGW